MKLVGIWNLIYGFQITTYVSNFRYFLLNIAAFFFFAFPFCSFSLCIFFSPFLSHYSYFLSFYRTLTTSLPLGIIKDRKPRLEMKTISPSSSPLPTLIPFQSLSPSLFFLITHKYQARSSKSERPDFDPNSVLVAWKQRRVIKRGLKAKN